MLERTNRLATAHDAEEALAWYYPRQIAMFEEYLGMLNKIGDVDKDAGIKAQPMIQGYANYLKNYQGMVESLGKGGVVEDKKKLEAEVRAWIAADPARQQQFGGVFEALEKLDAENEQHRARDTAFAELANAKLLGAARTIVRMAEERAKPDAERDPAYQERNWTTLEAKLVDLPKKYNRTLDRAVLTMALSRGGQDPVNADWLGTARANGDAGAVAKRVEGLYARTKLENDKIRMGLFASATTAKLKQSRDPMIQLAVALRPLELAIEERTKRVSGELTALTPRYLAALRAHNEGDLAPDANSTLRITYGTVRGYQPRPDADVYKPFTTLTEMVAKYTGKEPFDLPKGLLDAAKAKRFGDYADKELGDLSVDFLSDLDITGGNSGSATINARGEITGLAFDGNLEAMGSNWVFNPPITRTIHVDIRFVEWVMDAVDGADELLREMGINPQID